MATGYAFTEIADKFDGLTRNITYVPERGRIPRDPISVIASDSLCPICNSRLNKRAIDRGKSFVWVCPNCSYRG